MNWLFKIIKPYYFPLFIVLTSKIYVLFFVGTLAQILVPNLKNGLDLWKVWDVPNYLSLAASGYQRGGIEANFLVLLPGLPLLISLFKFLFQVDFLTAGFIISTISTILLSVIFYKLMLLDYTIRVASFAVLMLFIFPTSFFLHIPYSESLFILFAVASFYAVRKKYYWISFILIGGATFTKIAGLALIPAIFLEIILNDKQYFSSKDNFRKLFFLTFGILISLSGFLLYLFLNFSLWGDLFHFSIIQKQNYYEFFSPFGKGLLDVLQSLSWRTGLDKITLGYAQIIAFILGLIASFFALTKIRPSYGIYSILVLFFSYAMSFWICMPRYILPIFPIYIFLALIAQSRIIFYLLMTTSIIALTFLSIVFVQYGPVL